MPKITKSLVKEYGEQTYRDAKYRNGGKATKSLVKLRSAAWVSVHVAWGVGLISEKQMDKLHKAIVNYAKTTKFPINFI